MAASRIVLYAIAAFCNFAVAVALLRLKPWLAKLFSIILFSVVVTSGIYAALLMEKLAWFEFAPPLSEALFEINAIISAVSALALCVVFYRRNGEHHD